MTIENEELSDDQLFNSAVDDEPEVIPAAEVVIEQPEKPETEVVAGSEAPAEKPVVDDNAPLVPSWRLREINEEKRTLAERLTALEAEKATWQRSQPATEAKPAEQPAKPDPLLDPDGYEKYLDEKFEARRLHDRRDMDLALTRQANPEAFNNAHNEAMRLKAEGDPAFLELSQKMRTDNPGSVLLKWHQERSMQAEVGTDLNAYKQRLRDEALKDPEFRKAAMEAWREEAPTHTNGRPNVQLAPSLSGASRANAALRSSNDDVSDSELFEQTTG